LKITHHTWSFSPQADNPSSAFLHCGSLTQATISFRHFVNMSTSERASPIFTCVEGIGLTKSLMASSSMNARSSELRRSHMLCSTGHDLAAAPNGKSGKTESSHVGMPATGTPPKMDFRSRFYRTFSLFFFHPRSFESTCDSMAHLVTKDVMLRTTGSTHFLIPVRERRWILVQHQNMLT
jgi:hypothetical protein